MKHRADYRLLRRQLQLMRFLRIGEQQAALLQALLMGLAGAVAVLLFEAGCTAVQGVLTGLWGTRVACFAELSPLWRVLLPCLGALAAAAVLLVAHRVDARRIPDYMEAFSLGDGKLPRRQGLLRSISAVLSLGTGACIGKEGALMQIAAVAASAAGRWLHVSPYRLRLMVGCGAAAGMTVAFHTPLAACFFVSEIVVGSLSLGYLAPLLLASCAGYAAVWAMGDAGPLFACAASLNTASQMGLCVLLSLLLAPLGKLWVAWLNVARRYLNGRLLWLPFRMAAAGLLVGLVTLYQPEVVGNGQEAIADLLARHFSLPEAGTLLVLKAVLIALVFGVGTMGGVLTPTLMLGCFAGWCFGSLAGAESPSAFALIGMAAFFSSASRTPVTSLLLVVEFSLNASLIFPLMIAVGVAYGVSHYLPGGSLYDSVYRDAERTLHVSDIMQHHHSLLREGTDEARLHRSALLHPNLPIPVVDAEGRYCGLLSPNTSLAEMLPVLSPAATLAEALPAFERAPEADYLPVVQDGKVLGLVSRVEIYRTTALLFRRELATGRREQVRE